MMRRIQQFGPLVVTLALLVYVGGFADLSIHTAGVEQYRAQARAALAKLPLKVGPWEGKHQPIDARARDLLKPNAEATIIYQHTGRVDYAYYSVIQVEDARDMTGHAPANCYRGNGFDLEPPEIRKLKVGEFDVDVAVYRMTRRLPDSTEQKWVVYNYFIFPDGTFGHTLAQLDRAAEDYRKLKYGVAQVQVVMFNRNLKDHERDQIFTTLAGNPESVEAVRVLRSGLEWPIHRLAKQTQETLGALLRGKKQ